MMEGMKRPPGMGRLAPAAMSSRYAGLRMARERRVK